MPVRGFLVIQRDCKHSHSFWGPYIDSRWSGFPGQGLEREAGQGLQREAGQGLQGGAPKNRVWGQLI